MSIIFIGESEGEKELHLQKHEERTIRVLPIARGYLKEPIYHQKGEKNMIKIEDLHIGQTVYLQGIHPGKIIRLSENAALIKYGNKNLASYKKATPDEIYLEPQPKFDLFDLETVKALHYELWDWLERNPEKTKEDWPRWESNGGDVPDVDAHCFYCHYDKAHKSRGVCEACPSDWKINGNNKFVEDDTESPFCVRGIFGIYQEAQSILDESKSKKPNSIAKKIKSKAAHIIKNR